MIVDLISPWIAAESGRAPAEPVTFRARHAALFDALRRQRAADDGPYPVASAPSTLRALSGRASDPELHQLLRDQTHAAMDAGLLDPREIVLLADGESGDAVEPLPWPRPTVVLFLDRCADDVDLLVALHRGLASLTRWCATDSESVVRATRAEPWDRWQLARSVPLAEWIYAEGLGVHTAQALLPDAPLHRLLGLSRSVLRRLREREQALRTLLDHELEQTGLGLVLRWLAPQAPPAVRSAGATILPPMAGRYLAWRMTAERVGRVGIAAALRMAI